MSEVPQYRGTSLIRNTPLLGPYSRTIQGPMVVLGGRGVFLMSEVPLYKLICNRENTTTIGLPWA